MRGSEIVDAIRVASLSAGEFEHLASEHRALAQRIQRIVDPVERDTGPRSAPSGHPPTRA